MTTGEVGINYSLRALEQLISAAIAISQLVQIHRGLYLAVFCAIAINLIFLANLDALRLHDLDLAIVNQQFSHALGLNRLFRQLLPFQSHFQVQIQ